MVVITTGRRSGLKRRTPVNYARIDGDAYCMAGFGRRSDWYRNLEAHPEVEVWLPDGWWAGRAETVTDPEEWLPIMRQVMINSGFATPVFMGLDPRTVSDGKLQEVGAEIPVVRIHLERRVSGPGGPADLAWVWLVSGLAMLAWWCKRDSE